LQKFLCEYVTYTIAAVKEREALVEKVTWLAERVAAAEKAVATARSAADERAAVGLTAFLFPFAPLATLGLAVGGAMVGYGDYEANLERAAEAERTVLITRDVCFKHLESAQEASLAEKDKLESAAVGEHAKSFPP
jgi:hypothetical protein